MPKGTTPDGDQSVRPADLERAGVWLARHGLADVRPTPLLATRLAARRRTRLAADFLLAAFIITVALIYTVNRPSGAAVDGPGPYRRARPSAAWPQTSAWPSTPSAGPTESWRRQG
ncbi:hypothetical protein GCM10023083_12280 [Streptomyces phyllanthi]|nr:hypothetical protein [Streptomyces phyllanthi]